MNNVLEGSLFVNPNKKFDEIQSIIRQFQQSMSVILLSRIILRTIKRLYEAVQLPQRTFVC